ncbi:MAG: hypothetical protein Tsb0013_19230 [Phycisphaerales bacterium]
MTSAKNSGNTPSGGASPGKVVAILAPALLILMGSLYILTRGGGSGGQGGSSGASTTGADTQEQNQTGAGDTSGVASPETLETLVEAARTRIDAGIYGEAETMLRRGVETFPQDQTLRGMLGEALMRQGKNIEALGEFKAALAVAENATYRDLAATVANELGEYEEAANQWALAQKADPTNPKYPLYGAQMLRKLNRHDEARVKLLTAAKLDDTLHQAWAGLAGIAMDNGNLDPALQHVETARRLAPTEEGYIRMESTIRRRLGQGQRAAELLLTIDERRRLADHEMMRELALCYGMIEEPERAVDMYRRATQQHPGDAHVHFELALWAQRVGDLELAMAASAKALELGDERAMAIIEQVRGELGV